MPSYANRETRERQPTRLLAFSEVDRAPLKRLVGLTLARIERELILETLHHCDGNRTRSADILGISLRSLRDRIRVYRDEGGKVPEPHHSSRNIQRDILLDEKAPAAMSDRGQVEA